MKPRSIILQLENKQSFSVALTHGNSKTKISLYVARMRLDVPEHSDVPERLKEIVRFQT